MKKKLSILDTSTFGTIRGFIISHFVLDWLRKLRKLDLSFYGSRLNP